MAEHNGDTDDATTNHNLNESADKIRLHTQVKRGTGTRDQDTIDVKVRGDDPAETVADLNETLAELEDTAHTVRNMQPEIDEDEDDDDEEGDE